MVEIILKYISGIYVLQLQVTLYILFMTLQYDNYAGRQNVRHKYRERLLFTDP